MTRFPTTLHEEVAGLSLDFLMGRTDVDTLLVVNSCARGRAVPESDLDLAALTRPGATLEDRQAIESAWRALLDGHPTVQRFRRLGPFSEVHVDVFDGQFAPSIWDDGGGPDDFEVEIGNRVAHAQPLGRSGDYFNQIKGAWLPFYENTLRTARLEMVRTACVLDLDRVPFLAARGEYFAAFDWFYKAFREFLQGLFIARRAYPVSYTKWIREQLVEWLKLPELYEELPALLAVRRLEGHEIDANARVMRRLLEDWVKA